MLGSKLSCVYLRTCNYPSPLSRRLRVTKVLNIYISGVSLGKKRLRNIFEVENESFA